jgi:hypothetical protein
VGLWLADAAVRGAAAAVLPVNLLADGKCVNPFDPRGAMRTPRAIGFLMFVSKSFYVLLIRCAATWPRC